MRTGWQRGGALLLAAAAAAAIAGSGQARPDAGARGELLPDLGVQVPIGFYTRTAKAPDGSKHVLLGFYSRTTNLGTGPLLVGGHRDSTDQSDMTVDQRVLLRNGQFETSPNVGTMRYITEENVGGSLPAYLDGGHWHLLGYMGYELRRLAGYSLVARDQKFGFCLGDRYDVNPSSRLPGEPGHRVFNTDCAPGQTDLLALEEGISVGWGDIYYPFEDRQYFDVTGLAAGRYVLVHRIS